ncbi:uncharacterized protein BP01DRAFT_385297 [Aspergillus saccharolyticus JOP 1030-1]|uniref:Uncharacterized protein n=1 Tax=Aspergillus saccharolyticus JOP 1030-1 TaxID=1450539 RepID=A0A318ZG84_9EURO|nr:hypothetical protein BP01DRAFT_385297 [Aspergillus saccharolyticus JOP 1030-1]PYH42640.1 hypothetical protein BP01DRAFT_385297 [Aspergillus saccharolyticus JOP 1030-1]
MAAAAAVAAAAAAAAAAADAHALQGTVQTSILSLSSEARGQVLGVRTEACHLCAREPPHGSQPETNTDSALVSLQKLKGPGLRYPLVAAVNDEEGFRGCCQAGGKAHPQQRTPTDLQLILQAPLHIPTQ